MQADQFHRDKRVSQAKKMLLDALKEHQKNIREIKPPDPTLKQSYQEALTEFARCRGSKLWYPYIGSGIGHGPLVELMDGSVKYDCINGIGVHILGHSHPLIVASSLDAALSNTVMQGNLQQNSDSLKLMAKLTKLADKDHCFLTTSGVMANENALKIAFHHKFPATRILAFDHCFAGRTWAFSQITDKPISRQGLPLNVMVDYVPFFDPSAPEHSTTRALEALDTHLKRYPKEHAVMIFEFVQGEGGINVGASSFFVKIVELLKQHEVLIWADEIQTFGRTPELFAFHHFGLEKYIDLITIGKLAHTCATLYDQALQPQPGLLSQTFTSSTSMICASLTILEHLTEGNYYGKEGKIAGLERHFKQRMQQIQQKSPHLISSFNGLGTLLAFAPYQGQRQKVSDFAHQLFDAGVISFIAGQSPAKIRFLLSVTTTLEDLNKILDIVERQLK